MTGKIKSRLDQPTWTAADESEVPDEFGKILTDPSSGHSCMLNFSFSGGGCEIKIIRDGDVVGEVGIEIDSEGEISVLSDILGLEEYE